MPIPSKNSLDGDDGVVAVEAVVVVADDAGDGDGGVAAADEVAVGCGARDRRRPV